MTRDELVTIALRLEVDGTEAELDAALLALEKELPHSDIVTLLYHTTPSPTAEEAIDEALRRQKAWEQSRS